MALRKTTTRSTRNGTTPAQLAAGLKYEDVVKAQGGVAVNRQTGAKTYSSRHAGASSARDIDTVVDANARITKAGIAPTMVNNSFEHNFTPTEILNNAQQTALETIKPLPVTDPFALKEQANEIIGTEVNTIQKQIQESQKQQDALTAQIASFLQQSEAEKNLTQKVNNLDTSFEKGVNAIKAEPIPMNLVQGQAAALENQYVQQRNSLVRQLTAETASREQKLAAAKFLYDATRNRLSDTIELMKATAPDNIGSFTKPNGDMIVMMKNPLTGEVYQQNVGNTGTSAEKEANKELALKIGAISHPFYKVGSEIRNTATGEAYSTWEAFLAAGGNADLSNVFQYQPEQEQSKDNWTLKEDTNGILWRINENTGAAEPVNFNGAGGTATGTTPSSPSKSIQAALRAKYPEGSTGPGSGAYVGQCGVFTQAVTGVPKMGDTVASKKAMIDSQGIRAAQWRQAPQVGDVIIQTVGSAGHAAVVNSVNSDGTVTLSESNWNRDRKVHHTRRIKITDPTIYGAWRGNLKVSNKPSNQYGPPAPAPRFSEPAGGEFTSTDAGKVINGLIAGAGKVTNDNRYKLWEQAVAQIKANGGNPALFDAQLWSKFHPEGTTGYNKYVLGRQKADDDEDLF